MGSDIFLTRVLFIILKGQHQNLLGLSYLKEIETHLERRLPELSLVKAVVDKIILKIILGYFKDDSEGPE